MKKLIVFIVAAVLLYGYSQDWDFRIPGTAAPTAETAGNLQQAFELRLNDVQVEGQGTVVRTLRDDLEGSRHQKMIVRVAKVTRDSGQMGSLCMTRLSMDDNLVADINQGESVTFKVSAGVHSLGAIQISGGSKSGKTFCDNAPQEVKVTVSGVSGDTVAYRYSYAGSGNPALTVASF